MQNSDIYPGWEIVSERYDNMIHKYAVMMPGLCCAGTLVGDSSADQPVAPGIIYQSDTMLRHLAENLLAAITLKVKTTQKFDKMLEGTWLKDCRYGHSAGRGRGQNIAWTVDDYKKWLGWRNQLTTGASGSAYHLCFKLNEAATSKDNWRLDFMLQSRRDPSLRLYLGEYWTADARLKDHIVQEFGPDLDREVLLNLGFAARMYPKIWQGLETSAPSGIELGLDEAVAFLKEFAWILEDAGYKVLIPAWWTPEGRRRIKVKVKTQGKKSAAQQIGAGIFALPALLQYSYELTLDGEAISPAEWRQLVEAKTSLIQFRGQWLELDRDQMAQMLKLLEEQGGDPREMTLEEFIKLSARTDEFVFDHDDALSEMLDKLRDKRRFALTPDPPKFNGKLRDYQKRGISWIEFLESAGLNGCLADDMGLGKTIQVIARLINERESGGIAQNTLTPLDRVESIATAPELPPIKGRKGKGKKAAADVEEAVSKAAVVENSGKIKPTLLIAPTSVTGNWKKEMERFAPHLKAMIHHGVGRIADAAAFKAACAEHDLVITSYALTRMDEDLLHGVAWERVIIDEAQNIKNPKAAQTKAILKLVAPRKLALTGTPVENRLLDLWSIFNFLNPGYLGAQASFRNTFETPIQKENNRAKAALLKNLVEPFILRRVKTDKDIIKDLPDKVEQKVFCNLTKEQGSLYEAVVKNVMKEIEGSEGIQRRGLVLSLLMRLKQICNHPMQYLQDGSAFLPERSHKLARLDEMMEEVIESGESLLVFSQFKEICDALNRYLRRERHYNTYLLHGGTTAVKRQQMIEEFQHPDTEPSVFILSLKAGGVGITLTKANHVFHFDRWWNPAVENQATDRAFRIGQTKNVFVHKYVTLGTLEERIDQLIESKAKLAGSIIGDDEFWLTELNNDGIRELVKLNKQTIMD